MTSSFNSKKFSDSYHKYKIKKNYKTFKEICYPSSYNLQVQQKLLPEVINPKTNFKNILLFHKIGAGKTCTAVRIAEQWKHKLKIVIVVPASLIGNFRKELRSSCGGDNYIMDSERDLLNQYNPDSAKFKAIIKRSDNEIDKIYNIMSYNKFVDEIKNKKFKFKKTLLIIDEIQNMISEEGSYYEYLMKFVNTRDALSRLVIMTATPMFDKPFEIALTLNVLNAQSKNKLLPSTTTDFNNMFISVHRDPQTNEFVYQLKNIDILRNAANGIISYYRGAPPFTFPHEIIKIVKCKMSDLQYKAYKMVSNKEKQSTKVSGKHAITDLPNNFLIGSRIVSNVVYPNMKINAHGLESFRGTYTNDKLKKYSIKFYKILKKINSANGPVFIYSNFKKYGGILSFQQVLENNGYKNYLEHGEGPKRFAIWSGDETLNKREEIRNVYNKYANKNGSCIKIILGSPAIKEGVSLFRVKQVHIIEPTWNWSRMEQIIGRAVRFCSHRDLPKEDRFVEIYIYVAVSPDDSKHELTSDQHILDVAFQKRELIRDFEHVLKEMAIDCKLFHNANYDSKVDNKELKCQ